MIKNVLSKVVIYSINYGIASDHLLGSREFKLQLKLYFQSSLSSLNVPEHDDNSIADS